MKSERRLWKCLLFAVLLTVLAFVSGGCAADTYTVCPNGCEYTSIQAAINAAQLGDIIEVHSGTYYENVNVTEQLTLHGVDTGSGKPVVDAMNQGSAITLSVDGILLDGFYVSNSSPRVSMIGWAEITGAGIKVISNDNNLTNNTAINNNGIGMFIWGGYNNTLIGNKAINNEEGINLYQSGDNTLRNNQMLDNHYNFVGHFEDDIDISNTVDGKPIYYLVGFSDFVFVSD
jgi:parallel beta-helix repeat protein